MKLNFHQTIARYNITDYQQRMSHFAHHYVHWMTHDIPLTLVP